MTHASNKTFSRTRRRARVRSRITGNTDKPRLSVFRSASHIYAQLIDDITGKTLVSASSLELKGKKAKVSGAEGVGKLIAEKALAKNIKTVVFDRGGYKYHGRVKALAEAARTGGLKF